MIKNTCCAVLSCVWFFAIPWTVALQAPLSMEFARQEYWSRLSFPPPRTEPRFPALQTHSLLSEPPGKSQEYWSGLSFPSPGHLPDSGIERASPALVGRFFITEPPGKHSILYIYTKNHSPAGLYKDTLPSPGIRDELCHLVFRVVWGFVLSFLLNNCGHWATLTWVRSAWKYFSLKSKPSLPWQAFSWSEKTRRRRLFTSACKQGVPSAFLRSPAREGRRQHWDPFQPILNNTPTVPVRPFLLFHSISLAQHHCSDKIQKCPKQIP